MSSSPAGSGPGSAAEGRSIACRGRAGKSASRGSKRLAVGRAFGNTSLRRACAAAIWPSRLSSINSRSAREYCQPHEPPAGGDRLDADWRFGHPARPRRSPQILNGSCRAVIRDDVRGQQGSVSRPTQPAGFGARPGNEGSQQLDQLARFQGRASGSTVRVQRGVMVSPFTGGARLFAIGAGPSAGRTRSPPCRPCPSSKSAACRRRSRRSGRPCRCRPCRRGKSARLAGQLEMRRVGREIAEVRRDSRARMPSPSRP